MGPYKVLHTELLIFLSACQICKVITALPSSSQVSELVSQVLSITLDWVLAQQHQGALVMDQNPVVQDAV